MRRFGLDVRVEGTYDTAESTLFLSRYWYDGIAQPDFWRAWGKLGCLKLRPDEPGFERWFRAKCDAYYSQYARAPILSAVLQAVQSGETGEYASDAATSEAWGRIADGAVYTRRRYDVSYVTDRDRQWFSCLYGVTPSQQIDIERHLRSVIQYPTRNCGCLDMDSVAHPIYAKQVKIIQEIQRVPLQSCRDLAAASSQ